MYTVSMQQPWHSSLRQSQSGCPARQAARAAGDFLLVGLHTDEDVRERRGTHLPIMDLHERALSVLACCHVNEVIIGAPTGPSDLALPARPAGRSRNCRLMRTARRPAAMAVESLALCAHALLQRRSVCCAARTRVQGSQVPAQNKPK